MPVIDKKSVLSGLRAGEVMRTIVASSFQDATIEQVTKHLIKFQVNSILIVNEGNEAKGVVSKTNIMGAYYAGLPMESSVKDIMMPDPLFCHVDDSLESALDLMRFSHVQRLYVMEDNPYQAIGVLAYHDILGLLYRYCHKCEKKISYDAQSQPDGPSEDHPPVLEYYFVVHEVMTPSVMTHDENATLYEVMEGLEADQVGAALIRDGKGFPVGVVSKTDLILAYLHAVPADVAAKTIMTSPVQTCDHNTQLRLAIQKMIFSNVQRLFVQKDNPQNIVGAISLSDAARARSGSCRACTSSRIQVEESLY